MKNNFIHKNTNRVWEIDFLRGFAVALLVFDHLHYIVANVFGPAWAEVRYNNLRFFEDWYVFAVNYWNGGLRHIFGPFFAGVFIFISGLSTTFSKNNFKRGYLLLLFSFLLSIVSYYVMPEDFIHFGVLSLLSLSMLTWEFINRLFDGNKTAIIVTNLILGISLIVADYIITVNHIPPQNALSGVLTMEWYKNQFQFRSPGDFFPLYINMGIFMIGAVIGNTLYCNKKSYIPKLNSFITKPINFLGRHSLIFYIFPQLCFMIILALISKFAITGTLVII